MNQIENIRNEIRKYFNPKLIIQGSEDSILSPKKNFRIDIVEFRQEKSDVNWEITKVEVRDLSSEQTIFNFFVNESRFFYGWINKNNIEYLICAEDIFGGQTVIDLTNRKMSSYSPGEDRFIWTNFYLSPDGKTLATIGCYWACPSIIKLFDFSNPMELPLKEIEELEISSSEIIKGWLDDKTLLICSWQTETVQESTEDGNVRYKMNTILTEPERQILINF